VLSPQHLRVLLDKIKSNLHSVPNTEQFLPLTYTFQDIGQVQTIKYIISALDELEYYGEVSIQGHKTVE
jgi:hypothetical protein